LVILEQKVGLWYFKILTPRRLKWPKKEPDMIKPEVDLGKKSGKDFGWTGSIYHVFQILANSDIIYPLGDAIQNEKTTFLVIFQSIFEINGSLTGKVW
jgi:hypothetical protein